MKTRTVGVALIVGYVHGTGRFSGHSPDPTHEAEQVSPVEEVSIQAQDGEAVIGVVRRPPEARPFPAVIAIHDTRWHR